MNKLEKLISEFCPNGVEYKSIKRCVLKIEKINWKEHSGKLYKYIDLTSVDRDTHQILETQEIQAENAPSRAQQIVRTGDILLGATRPMLKRFCMVSDEYDGEICSTGFCVLRADEKCILGRWLYHIISSTEFFSHIEKFQKGASYPAISDADVKLYSMPVPPLEVQCEIVRILDNFTELTTGLTAELTAELTARKKQYEYYRDQLLNKNIDATNIMLLCEIADVRDGTHDSPKQTEQGYPLVTSKNISGGKIDLTTCYMISESDYNAINQRSKVDKDDILISMIGTIGEVAIATEPINYAIKNVGLIKTGDSILAKYLKYYLKSKSAQKYIIDNIKGTAPKYLSLTALRNFPVVVPSRNIQECIVNVLDNFDTICTDLNIDLPTEIEARQKQYEYYRDKLLTFKELNE